MSASRRYAGQSVPPVPDSPSTPDLSPDEERQVVNRVIEGNGESLAVLYAQHGRVAYSAALRLLRDEQDAEDVIQEMFVRLPVTLAGYDAARGTLGPWLRRVAVRLALMRLRGNRRRREVAVVEVAALLARDDSPLDRMTIEDALRRLTDDQRTVFLLKEVEGYEHREIAALLDISVSASEVRLYRARVALRALLGSSR
jgi:RNA polymerase sigma-70 factor (ECF subfamily)